ncbi:MAG: nucleotidyltransferase domain-containing protein [Ignavibacteriae bacterium]|nr:nucleotidyltransferase domain-containing protein [Ignavibacteriota bacterium]MCB9217563.1 nucleotidyltransferase domain-containing protein [Ignavibacteria bacterium]
MTRETILERLRSTLEPLSYVDAMWEGGSAAFNRVDEWSDIDVQVICNDERVEDAFTAVENAFADPGIETRYRLPEPTWHGHSQAFYSLADTSPFLMLDFVVMKRSNPRRMREIEIHGESVVHFDKENVLTEDHVNQEELSDRLKRRLEEMATTFDLFQPLVIKEIYRGNRAEALQFYHGMTLRPLVEVLRIKHSPARHNFHVRYIYHDLPHDIAERIESLFFVTGLDDLEKKFREAGEWFREELRTKN